MSIERPYLNVVVFEDDVDTITQITAQLDQIDAKVVGEAKSLPQAFGVLQHLANKEMSADVIFTRWQSRIHL